MSYLSEKENSNVLSQTLVHDWKIKAIIFDCDGTLIDTEKVQYLAWVHAFQKQGHNLTKIQYAHWNFLSGLPKANVMIAELGTEILGHDCKQVLLKDMYDFCEAYYEKGWPPIKDTINFLHQIAKEKNKLGLQIGLASGNSKYNILRHLRCLGIEKYFDVIVSGHDDLGDYVDSDGKNKPKPYVYLEAAKQLKLDPKQCVAIEDSNVGVVSAVTAGCITVAVPNVFTTSHDLSRANLIINSFSGTSVDEFLQMLTNFSKAC